MKYLTFNYSINTILNVNNNVFKEIIYTFFETENFKNVKLKKIELLYGNEQKVFKINLWINLKKDCSFSDEITNIFTSLSKKINHFLEVPSPEIQVFVEENENFI